MKDFNKFGKDSNVPIAYMNPDFYNIFKDYTYEVQMMVFGTKRTGKTNFLLWFYSLTNKKCVFWNSASKIPIKTVSDIVLDENDINSGKIKDILNQPRYRKICICPSDKLLEDDKFTRNIWNKLCGYIYYHEDKLFTAKMKAIGKTVGIDIERKSNIVLINDEILEVSEEGRSLETKHRLCIFKGGNYNVSTISGFQRYQQVPKKLANYSEWKVTFWIDDWDIWSLQNKIKSVNFIQHLKPYYFVVQKQFGDINIYKPIPLLLTKTYSDMDLEDR